MVWLVLDANAVAHRVYHAMGRSMSVGQTATGMVFGFLRDVTELMERHNTDHVVFCFDKGRGKRKDVFPKYKHTRQSDYEKLSVRDKAAKDEFRIQLNELRDVHLPEAGFRNVLSCDGYEADDLIASVVRESLAVGDEAIIVSSDSDLLQLLDHHIMIWHLHAKRMITRESFMEQWKIEPEQWPLVNAISGGHNDLDGVEGVAETLAARYLLGELSETSKAFRNIRSQKALWRSNVPLVTLPYEGCPMFLLQEDHVTAQSWAILCKKFGITRLLYSHPAARNKGLWNASRNARN